MLTTLPRRPAASMRRPASCAQKNTASSVVERTRRHSCSLSSRTRAAGATPALLTRMVTQPNAFSACSNAWIIPARSSTSVSTARACPPACSMRDFSVRSRSFRRATRTTAAPFSARTSAKRRPSPLEAPVTSATCPEILKSSAADIRGGPLDTPLCGDNIEPKPFPKQQVRTMSGHDHAPASELADVEARVRALETVLTEKGYVDPAALDLIVEAFETKVGPHIGARAVAKAWSDPGFKRLLLEDASKAVRPLTQGWRVGDHLVAVENTPALHNVIVCTLCSCYPWDVLGLPPVWYKSAPYRSRAVKEPRSVLAEFGLTLPPEIQI